MKVVVIGADTTLGKKLVLQAEEHGISVVSCAQNYCSLVGSGKMIIKKYDEITFDEIKDCHYLIDAVSFLEIKKFSTDLLPMWHFLELLKNTKIKLLEIGSCAFLYTDKNKQKFVIDEDDYPLDDEHHLIDKLCVNAYKRLLMCKDVNWSVLCPPLLLDMHGYGSGKVEFCEEVLSVGLKGDSYISAVDLSKACIELLKLIPKEHMCICARSVS